MWKRDSEGAAWCACVARQDHLFVLMKTLPSSMAGAMKKSASSGETKSTSLTAAPTKTTKRTRGDLFVGAAGAWMAAIASAQLALASVAVSGPEIVTSFLREELPV